MSSNDISSALTSAIYRADECLTRARKVRKQASGLASDILQNTPQFTGEWTQDAVTEHLQRLEDWIRYPIRTRNLATLQSAGIRPDGVPPQVLDDTEGVESIEKLVTEVSKLDRRLSDMLVQRQIILSWLGDGAPSTTDKLKKLLEAGPGYRRLLGAKVPGVLLDGLIHKALTNPATIPSLESTALKANFLATLGLSVSPTPDLDALLTAVDAVHGSVKRLEDEYGINAESLRGLIQGKSLKEAGDSVAREEAACSEQRKQLIDEWKLYAVALKAIGVTPTPTMPPRTLAMLAKEIGEFRKQCLGALGEEGVALFRFIKGDADFPEQVSKAAIKKALQALRPLILMSLREEMRDAEGNRE